MWGEITFSIPNCNGCTVKIWEWISNFIPYFTGHVVTYPCWELSYSLLLKGAPCRWRAVLSVGCITLGNTMHMMSGVDLISMFYLLILAVLIAWQKASNRLMFQFGELSNLMHQNYLFRQVSDSRLVYAKKQRNIIETCIENLHVGNAFNLGDLAVF